MEIHSFNTTDVEYKLYKISGAIEAMKYAVEGLRLRMQITDKELNGFYTVLSDASERATDIIDSLKPVLTGRDKRIVLLFTTQENEIIENC